MAIKEINRDGEIYNLCYEIRNGKVKDYILILHGWGSNKEIMIKAFENKFSKFKQIYLDLPGFGGSNINRPLKTKEYADIIENFINSFKSSPVAVMGHSFGGKVATLLNPDNLILLSSAGILEPKPFKVKFKIQIFKFLKTIGLGKFYFIFATKDVAGMDKIMYETLKNVVDEDFVPEFAKFKGRALIFWGENDTATKLQSGEKIHHIIKNSEFYPLKGDHFFFLFHSGFIANVIEEKISNNKNEQSVSDNKGEINEVCEVGKI